MVSTIQPSNNKRLWTLLLVIFIDSFGYFLVLPVLLRLFMNTHNNLLPHELSIHARHWVYSTALMLSPLAFICLSPLVGRLSDRYGRKIVIGGSLVASILGFTLPIIGILSQRISLILVGRFIAGAGTTSQPVAQAAMTDFSTGKKRAFNLALIGFAMTLSMVLGPITGAYLSNPQFVGWFSATTPYWVGVILTVINCILLWTCFYDQPFQHYQSPPTTTKASWSGSVFTAPLVLLLIAFFFVEINWGMYYQASFLLLPTYYSFSTNQVSLFASLTGVWMSIGLTVVYRFLLKFFSVRKIGFYCAIIIILSLVLLAFWHTSRAHWLVSAPLAMSVGIIYPSLLQLITDKTPTTHQGWMLGIASTLLGLAWMITGFFSAAIVDCSDWLVIIVSLLAAIATLVGIRLAARNNRVKSN